MANSSITFTPGEVADFYGARVPNLKRRGATEWRGPCPIHQGRDDNFAVDSATGRWFCHSSCGRGGDMFALETELQGGGDFPAIKAEVYRIIGRTVNPKRKHAAHKRTLTTYDYTDESGRLLFQVVRICPKAFKQRKPDGKGAWIWNMKGVRLVLYRLPELLKRAAETVFICEGEKDVHSLRELGVLATCNPMGAGKWRADYSEVLRGRSVVIIPDNDPSTTENGNGHYKGQLHAADVALELLRVGCETRIVELPIGKDASDWLAAGGTLEQLRALVSSTAALTSTDLAAWRARWDRDITTEELIRGGPGQAKERFDSSAFRLTEKSVLYFDPDPDKEPLVICGRLQIAASTRNAKGEAWGRLLRWLDSGGRVHEWAMPMSMLAGDGNEYRARLLDGGLFLVPGRKARELLTVYLQTMQPEAQALCVPRVGWHGENFVLPDATVGPESAEKVLFQTPSETEHYFNASGTIDDWRNNVGRFCCGNSRLILAVSCAFAGPLLSLVGGESGGFHFVGSSSTGKSTALQVGGSVLGGGGRNGFVQSWRITMNGLEATAELHNNLTLFLDELAQMEAREAAETAYLLGNGCGKVRMSRNLGARRRLSWTLLFVSAGELTLADHVQTAGKRTKGGAEVRLLNVEADAGAGMGLFENLHGAESPDAFARQLKQAVGCFYGSPLRAYLEFLTRNRGQVETTIRHSQADFLKRYVPTGSSGEVFRATQRFALVAAAGELASDAGITGWNRAESTTAAVRCLASWINSRGTTGSADTEAAINQMRRFLEAHGASRFQAVRHPTVETGVDSPDEDQVIVNRAGFRRKTAEGETEYLILPETFKTEVCAGFNYRTVARALAERGYLEHQPPDLTKRVRLPGNLGLIRAFSIRGSIQEG